MSILGFIDDLSLKLEIYFNNKYARRASASKYRRDYAVNYLRAFWNAFDEHHFDSEFYPLFDRETFIYESLQNIVVGQTSHFIRMDIALDRLDKMLKEFRAMGLDCAYEGWMESTIYFKSQQDLNTAKVCGKIRRRLDVQADYYYEYIG